MSSFPKSSDDKAKLSWGLVVIFSATPILESSISSGLIPNIDKTFISFSEKLFLLSNKLSNFFTVSAFLELNSASSNSFCSSGVNSGLEAKSTFLCSNSSNSCSDLVSSGTDFLGTLLFKLFFSSSERTSPFFWDSSNLLVASKVFLASSSTLNFSCWASRIFWCSSNSFSKTFEFSYLILASFSKAWKSFLSKVVAYLLFNLFLALLYFSSDKSCLTNLFISAEYSLIESTLDWYSSDVKFSNSFSFLSKANWILVLSSCNSLNLLKSVELKSSPSSYLDLISSKASV